MCFCFGCTPQNFEEDDRTKANAENSVDQKQAKIRNSFCNALSFYLIWRTFFQTEIHSRSPNVACAVARRISEIKLEEMLPHPCNKPVSPFRRLFEEKQSGCPCRRAESRSISYLSFDTLADRLISEITKSYAGQFSSYLIDRVTRWLFTKKRDKFLFVKYNSLENIVTQFSFKSILKISFREKRF